MNSLYWFILGGLVAVVVLVFVAAVTDVLVTANRGRVRTTPRRRSGNERTEAPGVLPPDEVERFHGEAHTQPLYRRDGRWNREP